MKSFWINDRKKIIEIFELFQNTDIQKSWLFINEDDESDDFIDMQKRWWNIPIDENYTDFEEWIEYQSLESIVNDHHDLLFAKTKEERIEIVSDIIDKIWIIYTLFTESMPLETNIDTILSKLIKYIITQIIVKLRLNPYLTLDKDTSDRELDYINRYIEKRSKNLVEIIRELNKDRIEEQKILSTDKNPIQLEVIDRRREFYKNKNDELREYYDMCIQNYIIILQSLIVDWNWYLPSVYNLLYDLADIWSALYFLNEGNN